MLTSQITGYGHHLPSLRIDNAELEARLQLEAGWIERRTGIQSRYWVSEDEHLIDLAAAAGLMALQQAVACREEIGLVILATSTPDHLLPPTAPLLADKLALSHCMAFDLAGACCGFIQALMMADAYVRTHQKSVLIVAANILSRRLDMENPDCTALFGDAAGAVVLSPSQDSSQGVLGMHYLTDGAKHDAIKIQAGGSRQPFSTDLPHQAYKMQLHQGALVFSQAIAMMTHCADEALRKSNMTIDDITHFVAHQSNARITAQVLHQLNIPVAKSLSTLSTCGNSSAASIPLTLSMAHKKNLLHAGNVVLLTAAGAGMSGGSVVLRL
jgi:3-oxoacyl-[acyl-carrier-protein] synthase-3